MVKKITLAFVALLFAGVICFADEASDAVVGSVEKVDTATKTMTVKTADGTEDTFKYTEKTTVTGAKDVASASDLAGKSSYHFVIHYTKVGSDKVATGMDYAGKGTWKATKGTVVAVDDSAKTVSIKTADGTVETYHVSEHCTVDAGKGIGKAGSATGESVAKGSEVTVHYTEEGGKKVAHFFKKAL
jgi:ABC-type Fe3+-hydroxamate transport system substrate-binding protein